MKSQNNQKIHFVTGKGGVGKSFFAAGLALKIGSTSKALDQNQRKPVLLAEINERSFYTDYLSIPNLGYKPTGLSFMLDNEEIRLDVSQWNAENCLKEYALHLLKIESLYKLFFQNPISKSLIEIAPGLKELAILGKATSGPRHHGPEMKYQQIVFDSFATGHFLSALRAPQALAETVRFGPMGEQSRGINKWLRDPDFCHIHIVTLPEELPITETIELYHQIKNEFGLVPKVYLNKVFNLNQKQIENESDELKNYFSLQAEQQERSRQLLAKEKIIFQEIPYFPKINTIELLTDLANHLKVNAKDLL